MKKRIKYLIAWAIAIVLLALFAKKVKNDAKAGKFILSIYFHSPSKALFEFCIKWLIKNDFRFLSQDDILSISQMKEPIPRAAVLITVDDGWLTNEKNIVEIANQYKVPVTIFVTTEAIQEGNFWWPYIKKASEINLGFPAVEPLKKLPNRERISILKKVKESIAVDREAMTVDQIKKIAKSNFITIGGHTATHPILINCDNEEAYRELKESKEIAEMWISKKYNCFCLS